MTTHNCPSHPCPLCYPGYRPPHYPLDYPHYGYGTTATPRGCICPPGAEKTCQGFGCPRKGLSGTTFAAIVDRNAERQDGETRLGPQDESGGAEGNRPKDIA